MPRISEKLIFAGAAALAVLLGILIYLPGLPGEFVFDDSTSIAGNPAILLPSLSLHDLAHAMVSSPTGALLRPLSMLSFALDAYFFGVTPGPFKLTNIFIHVACGLMLYLVATELLRARYRGREGAAPIWKIRWLSLGVATIWLVHPLNLTSVLYTVQRETALAGLFTAAGMYAYLVARRRQREERGGGWLLWLAVPALTIAGVFCKESAALMPVYLLVMELTLLGFQGGDGRRSRSIQAFFAVFLWLPLLGALTAAVLHPAFLFAGYEVRDFTWYERLLSEARILWNYLHWTALPDVRQLALFHDDIHASHGLLDPVSTLTSIIGILCLLGLAIAARKKLSLLSFGILWFFAGHLLESTVIPLELVYEHRNYLPIFGLLLGTIGTFDAALVNASLTRLKALGAAALIGALSVTTAVRAAEWRSELSFARSESAHHPGSPRALEELSWAYMQYILATKDRSVIPAAVDAAERSRAADKGSINQDIGLASMFAELGDIASAESHLARAAADAPTATPTATFQHSLQTLLLMAQGENTPLFKPMENVIVRATENPRAMHNGCFYADLWNTLGMFRYATREVTGSLEAMNKAATLCPSNALIHANYASILLSYGNIEYARKQLDMAEALNDVRMRENIAELETLLTKVARSR